MLKLKVAKPRIGENHPARVSADVTVNLNLRPEIKREWESWYFTCCSYVIILFSTSVAVYIFW